MGDPTCSPSNQLLELLLRVYDVVGSYFMECSQESRTLQLKMYPLVFALLLLLLVCECSTRSNTERTKLDFYNFFLVDVVVVIWIYSENLAEYYLSY